MSCGHGSLMPSSSWQKWSPSQETQMLLLHSYLNTRCVYTLTPSFPSLFISSPTFLPSPTLTQGVYMFRLRLSGHFNRLSLFFHLSLLSPSSPLPLPFTFLSFPLSPLLPFSSPFLLLPGPPEAARCSTLQQERSHKGRKTPHETQDRG